ncbi:MAG TPA: two-component regulator propeller domain-containing protein [Chitinophagaceae bacterium]|nr:two-component regulator propeller domain-containing protein [Chitinophagaceae bacterium]
MVRLAALYVVLLMQVSAFSQNHHFVSYNVDAGLPQSQAVHILQDEDRHLWITTSVGISRFDGQTFTTFSSENGLVDTYVIRIAIDKQQNLWGISHTRLYLIRNNKVRSFVLPETVLGRRAKIAADASGSIWCSINGSVYVFRENKFSKMDPSAIGNVAAISLFTVDDDICLLTARDEIYKLQSEKWILVTRLDQLAPDEQIHQVYFDSLKNIWVLTYNDLKIKYADKEKMESWFKPDRNVSFRCMNFDKQGNIWIGTNAGVYKIKPGKEVFFLDQRNGFCSNWVNHIITDIEGNVWLTTDGRGLFRYNGGLFTSIDYTSEYLMRGTFAITAMNDTDVAFGGNGHEFGIFNGKRVVPLLRNTPLDTVRHIYVSHKSSDGALWIGTFGMGVWKYARNKLERVSNEPKSVLTIYEENNKIFIGTNSGCYVYENGSIKTMEAVKEGVSAVLSLNGDTILYATFPRRLLATNYPGKYNFPEKLMNSQVLSLAKRGHHIFIGTQGSGLFIWERRQNTFRQVTEQDGLSSNLIYSVAFDNLGQLWAGTGRSVTKITSTDGFNTIHITNYGKDQGFTGLECNQNSIAVMKDNRVWFGTVTGAICYHPKEESYIKLPPKLVLQSVTLFSQPLLPGNHSDSSSWSPFYAIPVNPQLTWDKNNIGFEFKAMTYRTSSVRYSYFLKGLDKGYSKPGQLRNVVYTSLPTGDYVFHVKMIDEFGAEMGNEISYPFSIRPAFYQTTAFKALMVAVLLLLVYVIYKVRASHRKRQRILIENLRMEEQSKIRKKTAEDFHDEMGNKLARITVLSDILKSKLPANDDAQALAKKIQDNAGLLYQGTKDIIWSLNPKNDNLYSVLTYVNDFAIDLFHDTTIQFQPMHISEQLKNCYLQMDNARNIIMICKEALTNILKHSGGTIASVEVSIPRSNFVQLVIRDNGKGFDAETDQNGNGLVNMRQRAEYLNADVKVISQKGAGTEIVLQFRIMADRKP